jgi:hypothetical protein
MWAGLVVQDSYVRYISLVDPFWWRGRDGFIRVSPMPFGYWCWIKISRMLNKIARANSPEPFRFDAPLDPNAGRFAQLRLPGLSLTSDR